MYNKIFENAKKLIDLLLEKNMTISTSESLTGGMLSSALTDVPGSSGAFLFGNCTYVYEMKDKCYGLMKDIERDKTAVTSVVAETMAKGVNMFTSSSISLSTTGLAGPDGDGINPVGTVYIGISDGENTESHKFIFENLNRYEVKEQTVNEALKLAHNYIIESGKN